jgi:hypothetical protein
MVWHEPQPHERSAARPRSASPPAATAGFGTAGGRYIENAATAAPSSTSGSSSFSKKYRSAGSRFMA